MVFTLFLYFFTFKRQNEQRRIIDIGSFIQIRKCEITERRQKIAGCSEEHPARLLPLPGDDGSIAYGGGQNVVLVGVDKEKFRCFVGFHY